jgi:ATP-dependent protease ClpP protease subunit
MHRARPQQTEAAAKEAKVANAKKWYKIQAKSDDVAEISIFGDIGNSWFSEGVTDASFKEDFDKIKDSKDIRLVINSSGGNLFMGLSIYNIIASRRDRVSVEVYGVAASAASIIALGGRDLKMREGTFFMIHNAMAMVAGNAKDLRDMADTLDKVSGELVNIYETHSDLSVDEIKGYMDDEKWFTASEAIDAGFATEIVDEQIAASISIDPHQYAYKHIPEGIRADAEGNKKPPETERQLEEVLRDAGFSRQQAVDIAAHGFKADQRDSVPEEDQRDSEPAQVEAKASHPRKNFILLEMLESENLNKEVENA